MSSLPWWGRRLITVPVVLIAWALSILLSPVLFLAAALVDLWRAVRSRATPMAWRMVAILITYLTGELFAVVGAFLIWVRSGFGTNRTRLVRLSYKLQLGWGNLLWECVRVIFRLRIQIDGLEVGRPGPILILARHASIIDNVLPFQLFSRPHGMTLRYVIKKELLMDPALDIAGSWIPNHFVDRQATDPEAEIKALRRLGTGLTENDGLLIFPEGTRFTKRGRSGRWPACKRRIHASTAMSPASAISCRHTLAGHWLCSRPRRPMWFLSPTTGLTGSPRSRTSGPEAWSGNL